MQRLKRELVKLGIIVVVLLAVLGGCALLDHLGKGVGPIV